MLTERSSLTLPALGLLALVAGWLVFEGFREPAPGETVAEVDRPRYHLEGSHWRRFDDTGAALFEATVATIDYFDDESMDLSGIAFATRGGQGSWQLVAPRGSVAAGEKRLLLKPQVDVRGEPLRQPQTDIQTKTLWVDWATRTLTTGDPVVATAPGRRLEAVGMRADWAGERVEFLNDVKVRHDPRG